MEPLYWRLAADLHHIPSGANWSGLIGELCAGAAESVLVWQQAREHSSAETSGPNYTAVIGEHIQHRGFLIQSPQIVEKIIL